MKARARQPLGTAPWHRWAGAVALMMAGLLFVVLPALAHWLQAKRSLDRAKIVYAAKLDLVGKKGELERRVQRQGTALAQAQAKLVTARNVGGISRSIALAARAEKCSVLSIRPLEPRKLRRPDEKDSTTGAGGERGRSAQGKKEDRRPDFLEWPVRAIVQGEYGHICALLARVRSGPRCLRVVRLMLQPTAEDRRRLTCDFEIAGYGLKAPEEGG